MDIFEQLTRAQNGDQKAREQLVKDNLPLVFHIAKRFYDRGVDSSDLKQIGCIGLLKAIDNFSVEKNVKFSTYAVPMIQGEIRRFLRDDGMLRVSRGLKENAYKIKQAEEEIYLESGKEATIEEIAQRIGRSVEDVVIALESGYEVESLHKTVYCQGNGDIHLEEVLTGEWEPEEGILSHMTLMEAFAGLSHEEKNIVKRRYFLGETQAQIAKEMGTNQVQISRKEKQILHKMRKALG
ncbi:MAG: sigma-70 family RNA polymerase sigma factor [Lachnospiraceae bacterium]|nr:sigma-70 family RNA polymerase sigma factor [Lachnospiraceae bacterium]